MKIKFQTNHSKYFKEWKFGNIRILNDVYANVFYHYGVQKYDGRRWDMIKSYRTLAEAKEAAIRMIEEDAMDEARDNGCMN